MVKDPGRFERMYKERGYPSAINLEKWTFGDRTNEDKLPKSIKNGWN